MSKNLFCKETYALTTQVYTNDGLKFISDTGKEYAASPSDTLLTSHDMSAHSNKHRNTISSTAFNPIAPRVRKTCVCGRKVMSHQSPGADKISYYACVCGNITSY